MDRHSSLGSCSSERRWRPENPSQHRPVETCSDLVQSYQVQSTWLPCLFVLCRHGAEPVTHSALCTCCSYSSEHASPSSPTSSNQNSALTLLQGHNLSVFEMAWVDKGYHRLFCPFFWVSQGFVGFPYGFLFSTGCHRTWPLSTTDNTLITLVHCCKTHRHYLKKLWALIIFNLLLQSKPRTNLIHN